MDHQRQPAVDFDHHTALFAADPDRQWRELRQNCPIAWTEAHGGYWVVSDYHGNHEVLKNHAVFTTERLRGLEGATTVLIPQVPTEYRALPEEIDPPAHTPVRRMLNAVSSPAAAAAMMPRIRHWVTRHIDAVIESGACDFAYDIASPVPAHITFEWLGLPLKHAKAASEAFHDMLGYPPGHERFTASITKRADVYRVLEETVAARRAHPLDDTISYFTQYEIDGAPLPNRAIVELCVTLVGGGLDSTASLTTSALAHLHHDRALRKRLTDEPELLVPATEEFLRFYPPFATTARTARTDTKLRGCPISAGDRVLVSRVSANHDPEAFDEPERFVVERFPNRHVSFGLGVHRCSGSHLARLMFQEMMRQILTRITDYEIDEQAMTRYPDRGFAQGWLTLPARFAPSARVGPWAEAVTGGRP
jgi:cytochrome P450